MHIRRMILVGTLGSMLVACSAAATPAADVAKSAEPARPAPMATKPAAAAPVKPAAAAPAAAPGAGAMARTEAYQGSAAPAPAPAAAAAAAPPASEAKSELAQTTVNTDTAWLDRKIIRNATLSIWSENVERGVQQARQVAEVNGGFVSGSNTRTERVKVGDKDEDRQIATLTIQVPVQQFDRAIDALRQLGKVESEVGTSQDVTEEYVDLGANIQNLRKSEEAVQAMLSKATALGDVLTLTRELTQIRGQIERLEGRKRFLERRSELSSVTLTLQPPPATLAPTPTPTPTPVWDPSRTAERGWNASLRVLRAVAEVAILAVAFGWWLVLIGAIAGAVFLRVRRPSRSAEA